MSKLIKTLEIFNTPNNESMCSFTTAQHVLCDSICYSDSLHCGKCIVFRNCGEVNSDSITQLVKDYEQDN